MFKRGAIARAVLESLEQRRLMAGVVINEFLANNNNGILDQDNDHSDWIELRNTNATSTNLAGYYLTDDANLLTKWQFPSVTIPANGYLLVYASGKNRAVAGQQLHTNFALDADNGEYLALVKPGGTVIADSYAPFPPQEADISYGRGLTGAAQDMLIDEDAAIKVKVPTGASSIDSTWKSTSFTPDGTWSSGITGVGYERDTGYEQYIGLDVETAMYNHNTTAYMRMNFNVTDPASLTSLHLKMRYDDGFIVYLNGTELTSARRNAAGVTAAWNSASSASHADSAAVIYEDIDITANKGLLTAGANVLAIHGLNVNTTSTDFLISPLLVADRDVPSAPSFMATPTPGTANTQGTLGFVADTNFSVDRGFFDAPFTVAITSATPGAQIRYTLDGTAPTATTGLVYSTPVSITTTKTLRAAAFKTGWTPSDVDTQTYIFLNDVIHQTGAGLPAYDAWGHAGADWNMDTDVVNNPTYSGTIKNDLQAVPTMSLVMPWADWFGSGGQGIYIDGSSVEHPGSVEFISSNPNERFQTDAALEIQGPGDERWINDKLSIRVSFKSPFGPSKLNAPLFTNPTFDQGATNEFDTFILDAVRNSAWTDPNLTASSVAKYVQDQFTADLQNLAGSHGPHGRHVQLYLNGLYWGMYYLHERPDETFAEAYLGGNKDDYDVLKHNATTVVAGDNTAADNYASLLTAVRQNMTVLANYNAVLAKLDVDDFIDYMIVNQFVGNTDWARHNWYATFNRVDPSGRWRFHTWDAEICLLPTNDNMTQQNDDDAPTEIHLRLLANPEYKLRYSDHIQKLFANGGLLTAARVGALYSARALTIDRAIVGESARWGDNRKEPPYTRANWLSTYNNMINSYFPQRSGTVMSQFSSAGLLQSLAAPNYSQFGGTINPGYQLTISKPSGSPSGAVIYYTLDGSDPRLTGGAISSTAVLYSNAITLNVAKRVKARIYNSGSWSAIVDATFLTPNLFPVRISELHYHPANHAGVADPDDIEYIELVNTGSSTVNLQGVQITGAIDPYTFGSINLAAGQRIVVPHTISTFDLVYGGGINRTTTDYTGKLDNSGEAIILLGPLGETLQSFSYDDAAPWPVSPDGDGPSLEITNALGDPSDPANWHASVVDGGTPGTVAQPPVVVSSSFVSAAAHSITVLFDHDMDPSSFALADLDVQLQPSGSIFHPNGVSMLDSKTVSFTFTSPLADGNYHATLLAGSVKDAAGAAIAAAHGLDFFALNADANHDRHVDATDQAILTAHLGQAGTYADGDFDRNGTVNSADQTILNSNWHLWLAAQGAFSLPVTTGNDIYRLRRESATRVEVYAGGDVTATYRVILNAVTSLAFIGGSGNDTLTFDVGNGAPLGSLGLNFDGGNAGTDVLSILGSTGADTAVFSSTAVTLGSTITHAGVESRTFTGNGGGDNLTINGGGVALTANELFSSLTVSAGATLDVRNYGFAWNYTNPTPLASIETSIQLGRADGSWSGAGIITSMTNAKTPSRLATLGVAEAVNAVHFNGNATALWQTMTVDQTTLLVRYTYAGDATLDGDIDGDDYFLIDSHFPAGPTTYAFGDFDHNNRVDVDDYFLIDSNYNKPGVVALAIAQSPVTPAASPIAPDDFDPTFPTVAPAAREDDSAYKRLTDDEDFLTLL